MFEDHRDLLISNLSVSCTYRIEAERKWLPFGRWHFKISFLDWKLLYFYSNSTEVCFQGSVYSLGSVGTDNDLSPTRRQAIIWTNYDLVCIYASLDELNILVFCIEMFWILSGNKNMKLLLVIWLPAWWAVWLPWWPPAGCNNALVYLVIFTINFC